MCLYTGLPNALGGYDETPEVMSKHLKVSQLFLFFFCVMLFIKDEHPHSRTHTHTHTLLSFPSFSRLLLRMVFSILLVGVVVVPQNTSSQCYYIARAKLCPTFIGNVLHQCL